MQVSARFVLNSAGSLVESIDGNWKSLLVDVTNFHSSDVSVMLTRITLDLAALILCTDLAHTVDHEKDQTVYDDVLYCYGVICSGDESVSSGSWSSR